MRKILLLALMFLPLLFSCGNEGGNDSLAEKEANLRMIALDPLYADYEQVFDRHKINTARGTYDLNALLELYQNKEFVAIPCEIDEPIYEGIKGGVLYAGVECELFTSQKAIAEKYEEYMYATPDDLGEIRRLYRESIGNVYPATEAIIQDKLNSI